MFKLILPNIHFCMILVRAVRCAYRQYMTSTGTLYMPSIGTLYISITYWHPVYVRLRLYGHLLYMSVYWHRVHVRLLAHCMCPSSCIDNKIQFSCRQVLDFIWIKAFAFFFLRTSPLLVAFCKPPHPIFPIFFNVSSSSSSLFSYFHKYSFSFTFLFVLLVFPLASYESELLVLFKGCQDILTMHDWCSDDLYPLQSSAQH